jgi:hypothetical protein
MATTLLPDLNVVTVTADLAGVIVIGVLAAVGALKWLERRNCVPPAQPPIPAGADKMQWRMPPLALLEPVTWSTGTKLGMLALRGYLVLGVILLVVKAVQLSGR